MGRACQPRAGVVQWSERQLPKLHTSKLPPGRQIAHISEIIALSTSPQAASTEIPAVTIMPSNSLLGRVSSQAWTVYTWDINTGNIVPNADMVLGALNQKPNSGGHDHDSASRPKGSLSAYAGNTGATGLGLQITYTAPDVSGVVLSLVDCSTPSGSTCLPNQYYVFTTSVPGLASVGSSSMYALVGATASHSSNHFATPSFASKLQNVANAYFIQFGSTASPTIAINDISLSDGGLFDLGAGWTTPHAEHRIGVTGDIRTPPPSRVATLRQMLINTGIVGPLLIHVPPDAPHWHVREFATRE